MEHYLLLRARTRKLEKAVAVSRASHPVKSLATLPESHMLQIQFGQTCREAWVNTAPDLVPTFRAVRFRNQQLQPSSLFLTARESVVVKLQGTYEIRYSLSCLPSTNKGLPLPLGRGVCETQSKNGRARARQPFISRVFCAQGGSETMV